jgi:hypothetical protein
VFWVILGLQFFASGLLMYALGWRSAARAYRRRWGELQRWVRPSSLGIEAAVYRALRETVPCFIRYKVELADDGEGTVTARVALHGRDWWKFWRRP